MSGCRLTRTAPLADGPWTAEEAIAQARRCLGADTCDVCDVCIRICPDLCITRHPETRRIVVDLEYCKGCGLCAEYCPKGAIRMVRET